MKRILIAGGMTLAALGTGVFAVGAMVAEGALHPVREKIALVCPCMANETCTDAELVAADGAHLRAWHYQPKGKTRGTIIALHGIGGSRNHMVHISSMFLKHGYATLIPDNRGHGTSEGLVTYGLREAEDVHLWAKWLREQKQEPNVYGFGASLGASVLLESLNVEMDFRAVVAESAYSDFTAVGVERTARQAPAWIAWTAPGVVRSGLLWASWKYGADLSRVSSVEAVRRTNTPVFLIHGAADDKTEPSNSRRIAAANPSADLWIVPGSHHADAWSTTGEEFERRVLAFYGAH